MDARTSRGEAGLGNGPQRTLQWLNLAVSARRPEGGDEFGFDVDTSGGTAIVGARLHGDNAGTAYVLEL